ncbi:MAG: AAA family ATPase [Rhodobacteraceae bacterium]|nr:AAA family ATPase [Paracoccaceae bacterium]MBR29208.1 AAA family ATPase [Paracoccaceae bacterium]
MATAQQLIGLLKSHVEGNEDRFFDLALQLAAAEQQKGHTKLAEQLRQWVEAGKTPSRRSDVPTPIARPLGELATLVSTGFPDDRLGHLILPPDLEDELRMVVAEYQHREQLEEKGLRPRQRLLLAGPPGTGKTMTAAALAGELKLPLYSVLLHGLLSKFMGETAAKLHSIFEAVRTRRGVYLFDEIDALAGARGGENDVGEARRILNSFLQFLDEDPGPSLIVATTNLPKLLDRAILRRFDLVLAYRMPDEAAISLAMTRRLMGFDTRNVQWNRVAQEAAGLSAADVVQAAMDAARRAVLEGRDDVATETLIEAVTRRRNLQRLGQDIGRQDSPPHRSE